MKGFFSGFFGHSAFLQVDAVQEHMPKLFDAKSRVIGLDMSAMWVKMTLLFDQPPCPIGVRGGDSPHDTTGRSFMGCLCLSFSFQLRNTQSLLRFPFLKALW